MSLWWKGLLIFSAPIVCMAASPLASAATETVIYSFAAGDIPDSPLMEHPNGTLLGIAHGGGYGYGALVRLADRNGAWKGKETFQFPGNGGQYPSEVIEHEGQLFGTTSVGGANGAGTVFSLTRAGKSWTESVLYSFTGGKDGSNPGSGLVWVNRAGAFFGTTPANVSAPPNCGTVFRITPAGEHRTLYRFQAHRDGCAPEAELHELPAGKSLALAGTTVWGGKGDQGGGYGTVFVVEQRNGEWGETIIHRFAGGHRDGAFPGDLVVDASGNIFGLGYSDGAHGEGIVFELSSSGGKWTEKTIYAFGSGKDGENPAGLCMDSATGDLFGVATYGGTYGAGIVFELIPSNRTWTESVLHSFGATGDGGYPESCPVFDPGAQALYGTTRSGGQFNGGVAYVISLSGTPRTGQAR